MRYILYTTLILLLLCPRAGADEPLLIFFSFSMPSSSINALIDSAERAGGVLVLRGLKNNSFEDTIFAVRDLIKGKRVEVIIDPTLFRKYHVRFVPCFAVERCLVCGNITLEKAVSILSRCTDKARPYERKLERTWYEK